MSLCLPFSFDRGRVMVVHVSSLTPHSKNNPHLTIPLRPPPHPCSWNAARSLVEAGQYTTAAAGDDTYTEGRLPRRYIEAVLCLVKSDTLRDWRGGGIIRRYYTENGRVAIELIFRSIHRLSPPSLTSSFLPSPPFSSLPSPSLPQVLQPSSRGGQNLSFTHRLLCPTPW